MSRPVPIHAVLHQVCSTLGVSADEMCGPFRNTPVIRARRLFVELAKRLTVMSYPEIAPYVSGPGAHTTAITLHKGYRRDKFLPFTMGNECVSLAKLADQLEANLRRMRLVKEVQELLAPHGLQMIA